VKSTQPRTAIVFDLEFTAWEGSLARGWSEPGEFKEIVQIGAVKLDRAGLKMLDSLTILVQPRVNPMLSDYLVALTGITNEALAEQAVDFITAYRVFLDFVADAGIWAFGGDDRIIAANLALYGLEKAMPIPRHTDVCPWFAENGVDLRGKHACDTAEAAGARFDGRRHNALDDARSVALGMATLVARGAPNPFTA